MTCNIRFLDLEDAKRLSQGFTDQGWNKPIEQFQKYYQEQQKGIRQVFVAETKEGLAGYVTVVKRSDYDYFKEQHIPEIMDFNVLIKDRRKGIGALLMNEAEQWIKTISDLAGLRVGLISDYGAAQILYVKRGYIPDGQGIHYQDRQLHYFDAVIADDDLTLAMIKQL